LASCARQGLRPVNSPVDKPGKQNYDNAKKQRRTNDSDEQGVGRVANEGEKDAAEEYGKQAKCHSHHGQFVFEHSLTNDSDEQGVGRVANEGEKDAAEEYGIQAKCYSHHGQFVFEHSLSASIMMRHFDLDPVSGRNRQQLLDLFFGRSKPY